MNVRNCRKCGKLFNYIMGVPICPACREKLEETFQVVKKYIRENKLADIKEVAEACEVEHRFNSGFGKNVLSLHRIHQLSCRVKTAVQ